MHHNCRELMIFPIMKVLLSTRDSYCFTEPKTEFYRNWHRYITFDTKNMRIIRWWRFRRRFRVQRCWSRLRKWYCSLSTQILTNLDNIFSTRFIFVFKISLCIYVGVKLLLVLPCIRRLPEKEGSSLLPVCFTWSCIPRHLPAHTRHNAISHKEKIYNLRVHIIQPWWRDLHSRRVPLQICRWVLGHPIAFGRFTVALWRHSHPTSLVGQTEHYDKSGTRTAPP